MSQSSMTSGVKTISHKQNKHQHCKLCKRLDRPSCLFFSKLDRPISVRSLGLGDPDPPKCVGWGPRDTLMPGPTRKSGSVYSLLVRENRVGVPSFLQDCCVEMALFYSAQCSQWAFQLWPKKRGRNEAAESFAFRNRLWISRNLRPPKFKKRPVEIFRPDPVEPVIGR